MGAGIPFFKEKTSIIEKQYIEVENSKIQLESGFKISYDSLKKAEKEYTSSKSIKHIEKAWDVYRELASDFSLTKEKSYGMGVSVLYDLANKQDAVSFDRSFDDMSYEFSVIESMNKKIGSDMKYISQELTYAEKAQKEYEQSQKFCFLFWCW